MACFHHSLEFHPYLVGVLAIPWDCHNDGPQKRCQATNVTRRFQRRQCFTLSKSNGIVVGRSRQDGGSVGSLIWYLHHLQIMVLRAEPPSLGSCITPQIKALDQELIKYKNALKKSKGAAAAGIKKRAIETLKRKKMYEQQRDQMAAQQFNIEQTSFAIDSVKDTATTVRSLVFSCPSSIYLEASCRAAEERGWTGVPCHSWGYLRSMRNQTRVLQSNRSRHLVSVARSELREVISGARDL